MSRKALWMEMRSAEDRPMHGPHIRQTSSDRHRGPGDFRVLGWVAHKPTLFDVTTSLPTQSATLSRSTQETGVTAQLAYDRKLRNWAQFSEGSPELFIPLAVEMGGVAGTQRPIQC